MKLEISSKRISTTVLYNSDSDVVFKNVRYNINTLGLALKREFAGKEQAVRLSANKDTPLQEVVTLMDVVRNAGFEKIFISTEAAKDKRK